MLLGAKRELYKPLPLPGVSANPLNSQMNYAASADLGAASRGGDRPENWGGGKKKTQEVALLTVVFQYSCKCALSHSFPLPVFSTSHTVILQQAR